MINIGVIGYGNLGKGVEKAIKLQPDMNLFGVFTRRDPKSLETDGATAFHFDDLLNYKDDIDVLIHCGSSEFDLRDQTPVLARDFNIVDSFDMHAIIDQHIEQVRKVTDVSHKTALVSVGWDPGFFSMNKTVMDSILLEGKTQSFWGYGISQGHSNVASKVEGVKIARNYSVPNQENIEKIKNFEEVESSLNNYKECYIVAEEGADLEKIKKDILNIEHYFKGSDTRIHFISEEEMKKNHHKWAQGGRVIHTGQSSEDVNHRIDLQVDLDSNPEFTASVLVAYARAVYKMHKRQEYGTFTALDIRPKDMSSKSYEQLVKEML